MLYLTLLILSKLLIPPLIFLTLIHHPLLILFFFHLTMTFLLVVSFLLSLLKTIFLFFSLFPLNLLTVLPLLFLLRSGCTISLTLSTLILSSAPLIGKNYSPCQILTLPCQELFLFIMTTTAPSKLVYALPTLLFLSQLLLINQVNIRKSIFSSAKRTGSSLLSKCCSYRNKTLAYLRHLKFKFFHNLLTSPSSRCFGSAVKCIHSKPVYIRSLFHNDSPLLK